MGQLYSFFCCKGTQNTDIENLVNQNDVVENQDQEQQNQNQKKYLDDNYSQDIDLQQSQCPAPKIQENNQKILQNIEKDQEIQIIEEKKEVLQVKIQQEDQSQKSQESTQVQTKPLKSWELKKLQQKKLNIEDYRFIGKTNELLIKRPGEINGKQFVIDNCKDCTILILDSSSTLSIDDCENCRIVIGPSQSSVFVRTTKNSNLIIACGQFRSRDCHDLKILLQCRSQPVIESSSNMQFGCFRFYYKELIEQFKKESLNIWNNNWSDIYDFTKNPKFLNFSYLPFQVDEFDFLKNENHDIFSVVQKYEQSSLIVPVSLGLMDKKYDYESMFLLQYDEKLDFLVYKFNSFDNFILKRSYMTTIDQSKLNLLDCGNEVLNQKCLFLYVCSSNINITEDFENLIGDQFKPMQKNEVVKKFIKKTWTDKTECKNMCDLIYQNWEDERH